MRKLAFLSLLALAGCSVRPVATCPDPPVLEVPYAPKPEGQHRRPKGVNIGQLRPLVLQITDSLGLTSNGTYTAPTLAQVTAQGSTFAATLTPTTDNARDLGDSTHRMRAVYATTLYGQGAVNALQLSDGLISQPTGGLQILSGSALTLAPSSSNKVSVASTDVSPYSGVTTLDLGNTTDRWRSGYFSTGVNINVATGTAPLTVASTTKVSNLNADSVDGIDFSSAASARSSLGVQNVWLPFVAGQGIHPTSNSAALSVHGSTLHGCYAFDPTTAETIIYESVLPSAYDSTRDLTVTLYVSAVSTSGNPVVFSAEIEAIVPSTTDLDADSYDTAVNSASTNTSSTSGIPVAVTIALSNTAADDIAAGQPFRLRIGRVPTDGGDTLAVDANVIRVVVSQ